MDNSNFAKLLMLPFAGAICVGVLLFFHFVPKGMVVFPKEHPSFADTFIDLDGDLRRFNEADPFSQIGLNNTYKFRKLAEKGLIKVEYKPPVIPDDIKKALDALKK